MEIRTITIFIILLILPNYTSAQLQRPSIMGSPRVGGFILRTRPNKEQKKNLLPNPLDLKKYERFLSQPKTGIFRLMPDIGCTENINVIKADAICLRYIPESSYYSFREKEHTIEMLSDIRLRNGYLISDGILSQGILVHLGDVELEKVMPQSDGVSFIASFSPNTQILEAQKQNIQFIRGIKSGNYEYKKALPLFDNGTYVLRVIAYKGNIYRSFRGFRFDLLEGDKRADITIAFRIVRKESDDSITLLWKEIERKESPRMIFPKRPKKS